MRRKLNLFLYYKCQRGEINSYPYQQTPEVSTGEEKEEIQSPY
jgi:hypothetical protein